jgi:hypothetical protein
MLTKSYGRPAANIRLTSILRGTPHHVTIPVHDPLKVGTLVGILSEIASYLEIDRDKLHKDLFEK